MGVNREKKHVLVLPEDDANHQLATGFALGLDQLVGGRFKVLPVARGWIRVLELFISDHVVDMGLYRDRFMILLIDFDGDSARLRNAQARIPSNLMDRVFVLGSWLEPQDLTRSGLGSCEESVWLRRRIVPKGLTSFGITISCNTTRASLPAYANRSGGYFLPEGR